MLMGGADGMPRRHADWVQGGWMVWGNWMLILGLVLGASYVVYAISLWKSRDISASPVNAPEAAE